MKKESYVWSHEPILLKPSGDVRKLLFRGTKPAAVGQRAVQSVPEAEIGRFEDPSALLREKGEECLELDALR